ncbi:hypothetical protein IKR55_00310 [bacterium]|nr:hypothetical protein [Elusimicrobiota bacterium]MBR6301158.1 hypothetical protein [bacterium]
MANDRKDKLTPKQEKFVQGVINGLSYADAYRQAYPNTKMSDENIYSEASNMINGTGNYKDNPKVHTRFVELNQKAVEKAKKADEKKIADASEILTFLSSVMRDENAEYKDRMKAAELSGKRFGIFSEHVQINENLPPVIIDDVRE